MTSGAWRSSISCASAENEASAFLYAFDLLELDGADMRREPIEVRKATLASILRKSRHGVRLNEHLEHPDGLTVFQHACQMGLEGIVSKRLGSRYRSGRSPDWLKFKNPAGTGRKREAEEDWGRMTLASRKAMQGGISSQSTGRCAMPGLGSSKSFWRGSRDGVRNAICATWWTQGRVPKRCQNGNGLGQFYGLPSRA